MVQTTLNDFGNNKVVKLASEILSLKEMVEEIPFNRRFERIPLNGKISILEDELLEELNIETTGFGKSKAVAEAIEKLNL